MSPPEAGRVIPPAVDAFRRELRARQIPPRYSGGLHLAFTSAVCLGVVAASLARVHHPGALELLTVPVTFLFANLVEYRGHRGPMHHRRRGLGLVFERHARQHHRFYTHEAMSFESPRDYKMVLFPPVLLVFFLGLFGAPVAALLFLVASSNVAWLYLATAIGYYLTYEWLHFSHHLPPQSRLGRLPLLSRLRAHHQAHHDPAFMATHNFNITFPIGDALFGTIRPWTPSERRPGA